MQETAGILERSGTSIHYWVAGPSRAPLLAFTHGASMDHRMFERQLPVVWEAGYRTLRWDVRGHGRSRPFGPLPWTLASVADDLLALLDNLLLGRQVCLVGHAFGGQVAQQVVFQRPESVAAMVIVGSRCLTVPMPAWHSWSARGAALTGRLRSASALRHQLARAAAIVPAVQTYAFEATHRLSKGELVRVGRAGAAVIRAAPGYRIDQPVLLTHGEFDRTRHVVRSAATWAARDPRCRYEVIRRAGPHAHQDNPTAFNQLLVQFLAAHVPLPRGLN